MNKLTTHHTVQDGWTIHIYSSDRRLLCSLDPSHGWALAVGGILGVVVALVGFSASSPCLATQESTTPTHLTAPLQVD